jgi:hypothetical protein
VSSAILYLAIVAIWALVLVPRWLHPRHGTARAAYALGEDEERPADGDAGFATAEAAGEAAPLRKDGEPMSPSVTVGGTSAGNDASRRNHGVPRPAGPPAAERYTGRPPAPARVPVPRGPAGEAGEAAQQHATVVRSRRRLLATLIALTAVAAALAATRYAASWIILPPAIMLMVLLLLLRAAARSDAQRAFRFAEPARDAEAGPGPSAHVPAQRAGEPSAPWPGSVAPGVPGAPGEPGISQPAAEVIDISGRVADQVYDQYADMPDRAVGD